jgi:hypothetical protein
MRTRATIVHPTLRSARVADMAAHMGLNQDQTTTLREAMTPPALLGVPDHAVRGQKSLTRIQQLTNRRRFKRRLALSR